MEIFISQKFIKNINKLKINLSTITHPQIQKKYYIKLKIKTQKIQKNSKKHLQLYKKKTLNLKSINIKIIKQ